MKQGLSSIGVLLMLFLAISCSNEKQTSRDWPQFLGPDRDGTSDQAGILRTWPASGPKVLWSVNLGIGYGGPVIKDGKVYILDRDDESGDILRCFDFSNGAELWKFSYDAPGSVMFPGSRSVPTVDGNYIYSCGPYGDLYCIDLRSHEPVWRKNIWTDFGGDRIPTWAITQNPLIHGDLLIVASQAPEAGVVAYNKLTGDLAWKTPSLGAVGYVSPSIVKIDGEDHVAMVSASERRMPGPPPGNEGRPPQGGPPRDGSQPRFSPGDMETIYGKIVGIKPTTGEILWEYDEWDCHIPVPSALDAGDNRVIVVGGYELGTVMIKVDRNADGTYSVTELFKHNEFGDHTKPPILYNDHFYGQFSTNSKRDGLVCMDMNGNILWKTTRKPLFDKGSMILADGLILATDGRKTLYLIEPDPSGYKQLASADLLAEGGTGSEEGSIATRVGGATQNWAPLALANGKLLIRDQARMLCVEVAR